MTYGIKSTMNRNELIILFVTLLPFVSAIRVDWNTNKGPIVPPTTTIRPVPKFPYHDPAPVWENFNDDVINPNPYRYVLPPPSRPKLVDDNYLRAPLSPKQKYEKKPSNYGEIVSKPLNIGGNEITVVPTLAVEYVPNIGFKYNAVILREPKVPYVKNTNYYYDKPTKLHGKYNPKSKKYKVYEKVKYHQNVYFSPSLQKALPYPKAIQQFRNDQISTTQQTFFQHQLNNSHKDQLHQAEYYPKNALKNITKSQQR